MSVGAFQAFSEKFSDLTIVQFDAHTDLRPEYEGSKFNHACAMARGREFCPIIQIGIRSVSVDEKPFIQRDRVFFAHEIHDNFYWLDRLKTKLSKYVYVTIDLDCFDPAFVPSTGTPEPGGLGWYQMLKILECINLNSEIVGFDVVELCPNPERKASDLLAAKLVYKLLTMRFIQK